MKLISMFGDDINRSRCLVPMYITMFESKYRYRCLVILLYINVDNIITKVTFNSGKELFLLPLKMHVFGLHVLSKSSNKSLNKLDLSAQFEQHYQRKDDHNRFPFLKET